MRPAIFIIACLPLSACYSLPEYQAARGQGANLRVVLTDPKNFFAYPYSADPANCKAVALLPHLGGDNSPDPVRVGMPEERKVGNDHFERRIAANETSHWAINVLRVPSIVGGRPYTSAAQYAAEAPTVCPLVSFQPQPNANYEMVIELGVAKCDISVYSISTAPSGSIIRTEVATETDKSVCSKTQAYAKR
jgi:hypothetical protein